ncbi:MAG: SPOR domain-containing protein [Deltaproteobacteria bacterium]|nr:SPOR domain-containing protein [Deltaproteobacteria bacterium]
MKKHSINAYSRHLYLLAAILFIFPSLFFMGSCFRKDQPEKEKPRVTMPIKSFEQTKPPASEEVSKDGEPVPENNISGPEKTVPPEEQEPVPQSPVKPSPPVGPAQPVELPPPAELPPSPESLPSAESPQIESPHQVENQAPLNSQAPVESATQVEQPKGEKEPVKKVGYCKTQKGDSLFKIAGRKDVYGDSNKWPSLFRLNMDLLNEIISDKDSLHKELPEGLELNFILPSRLNENLLAVKGMDWVISAHSGRSLKKIVPISIMLMKNGYKVYITRATVRGEAWMRVRVGFFKDQSEAKAAADKIMTILKTSNSWVLRTGKVEKEEYGGY